MGECHCLSVTTPFVLRDIPRGTIALWSGTIADIPLTWRFCDGTRLTPDLRNKFIVGAGDTYAVDASGGVLTHSHPFTGDGHSHGVASIPAIAGGIGFGSETANANATGITDAETKRPPYHSLCWVMYDGRLL